MVHQAGSRDDRVERCREALTLWLSWNEQYTQLSQEMFAAAGDQRQIERLGDELDALRVKAAETTRQLLRELD